MLNPQGATRIQSDAYTQIYLENWTEKNTPENKTPVLFVHGGPGLYGYMGDLAQTVGQTRSAWTYFQRGKTYSETSGAVSVDAHVADLKAVLQKIGDRPVVVGHSWGAMLAAMTLLESPELASKLIAVGPMPFDAVGMGLFVQRIEARLTPTENAKRAANMSELLTSADYAKRNVLFRAMSEVTFKAYQRHPTMDGLSAKMDGYDVDAFFATHGDLAMRMGRIDFVSAMRGFTLPLELIYGDYDPSPCERLAGQLKENLPHTKMTVLAECGHYPWWESPKVQKAFFSALAQGL